MSYLHNPDDADGAFFATTGSVANPDRVSNGIRRRERMTPVVSVDQTDYTAMLSPESLASYLAYKNGEKKTDDK